MRNVVQCEPPGIFIRCGSQGINVRSVYAAQDDTASPSLDSFNLLSLMEINTAIPHRTGILNNRVHISNVHGFQIPNKYSKRFKRLSM